MRSPACRVWQHLRQHLRGCRWLIPHNVGSLAQIGMRSLVKRAISMVLPETSGAVLYLRTCSSTWSRSWSRSRSRSGAGAGAGGAPASAPAPASASAPAPAPPPALASASAPAQRGPGHPRGTVDGHLSNYLCSCSCCACSCSCSCSSGALQIIRYGTVCVCLLNLPDIRSTTLWISHFQITAYGMFLYQLLGSQLLVLLFCLCSGVP